MIKAENFTKILKNPRNFPEESLTHLKFAADRGGHISRDRTHFPKKFSQRGSILVIPPCISVIPMLE